MSSLHQDHLLVEGPEPVTGTSTLASARGTSRRRVEGKATTTVPTQRQGKSQRSGSAPTTVGSPSSATASTTRSSRSAGSRPPASPAAASLAARARAAAAAKAAATTKAAGAKAATAKAATAKAAGAKAVTAKAATVKAAAAARTAAAAKVSHRAAAARTTTASSVAAAKAATAKPSAAEPAATKRATAAKATPAAKPAPAKATAAAKPAATPRAQAAATPAAAAEKPAAKVAAARPTPYKRTPTAAAEAAVEATPTDAVTSDAVVDEVAAREVVASIAEGRRSRFLRRRPPSIRRRPSLYLAAALVGAVSVSGFTSGDPVAQATDTMSHSVSVAQELGITAEPAMAVTDTHAAERLEVLAASRNARGADQAAAAQAQAVADQAAAQAAAEAARPKAVHPVNGARLTSTFGPRWGTLHAGIDLAAPIRTPEMAVMDGVVLEAGPASGFGLAVYIQHENGDVTVYGHMDEILVQAGQVVRAGDTIALLGNRGQSTGPHLHFEVHVGGIDGQKIDPLPWMRDRGIAI